MNRAESFPNRLAAARAIVATCGVPHPPGVSDQADQVDQVDAASAHAARLVIDDAAGRLGVLTLSEARRLEVAARALAAVLDLTTCEHLRRGPRPATALLGLAVIACRACYGRLRHLVVDTGCCGWCAASGVAPLGEFGVNVGPLTVTGAACAACCAALSGDAGGAL